MSKESKDKKNPSIWNNPKIGSYVFLALVIALALWLWLSHSELRNAVVDWINSLFGGRSQL